MPREAIPVYLTAEINRVLGTNYRIEDLRAILREEREDITGLDIEMALAFGEIREMRAARRLKHPDAKKNPGLAVSLEILRQLL